MDKLEVNSDTTTLKVVEPDDKSSINLRSSVNLLKCPICHCFFDNEEDCFEHFLDYFDHSQHFLFHRFNLVFWLNSYFRIAPADFTSHKLSPTKDENIKIVIKTESCIESEEKPALQCEVCKESFLCEEDLCIHSSIHVSVKVPPIDLQLKCPLCEKYFCRGESCLMHILTHMKVFAAKETRKRIPSFTHDVFQPLKKWMAVFFCTYSSDKILTKYNLYEQNLNTPLLSKVLWSEIKELKNCKLCEKPVTSIFDLLNNHLDCKPLEATKSAFCILCNFKAADMDALMSHFFSDHIFCYCGYHGDDFDTFISHTKDCVASKNGILCPCCRVDNFVTPRGFQDHIEETRQKACGSVLKKSQWVCVICKTQSSHQDIFYHILTEHVSCLCGYVNIDMKSFFKHTAKCVVKKTSLFCPICRKVKYSSEAELQQHVSQCLPWNGSDQKLGCIEAQNEKLEGQTLKRKGSLSVEVPSKRTKFGAVSSQH